MCATRLTFGKSKVETRRGSVDLALALVFKAYVCYVFCNQMWLVVWGEFIHRFGRRMNNEFNPFPATGDGRTPPTRLSL